MNILRSLDSIVTNAWGSERDGSCILNNSPHVPLYTPWDYSKKMVITDIALWEQLYHEPGNVGLFVAWNPYIEYYLLVFYPFLDSKKGFKSYYGIDVCYEVASIMQKISVEFDIKKLNLPTVAI